VRRGIPIQAATTYTHTYIHTYIHSYIPYIHILGYIHAYIRRFHAAEVFCATVTYLHFYGSAGSSREGISTTDLRM